jgi:hypothetical protein
MAARRPRRDPGDRRAAGAPVPTPERGSLGEALERCDDYLSRSRRSLDGEIAPDRPYFLEKSQALRDAAETLVRLGQDADGWMRSCGAPVAREAGRLTISGQCELPVGHRGAHDDDPRPSSLEAARDESRAIVDQATRVANHLSGLLPRLDQRRELASREDRQLCQEAGEILSQVAWRASQLGQSLEALACSPRSAEPAARTRSIRDGLAL